MSSSTFDSDFYINTVKRECINAYNAYLLSESVFMFDSKGLGLDKEQLQKFLKSNHEKLKKALLEHEGVFEDFFSNYMGKEKKIKLSSFLYDLYNILTLAVYLDNKYFLKVQNHRKLDKKLLSNNLALSIIEGSAIGRYESFKPYLGRTYSWQVGDIEHGVPNAKLFVGNNDRTNYLDDFYYAQNTFLQHQLLMLVVLHYRDKILPRIYHSKVGQKNIITNDIEITPSSVPDNYLDDHKWSSSLINIITNFDYIMSDLKSRKNTLSRVKLANIFFSKEFIDNFNFDKLFHSYIFKEDPLTSKLPSEANITETIGRIIESRIQEYTNKKNMWSHVVNFTKFFPHQVQKRKNNHIDFSDGKHIYIYNHHHTFGIMIRGRESKEWEKLTFEELQNKFRRNKDNATSLIARKRELHKKPYKNKVTSREAIKKLTRKELRGKLKRILTKDNTTSQVQRKRLTGRISTTKNRHFKLIRFNEYFLDTYLF